MRGLIETQLDTVTPDLREKGGPVFDHDPPLELAWRLGVRREYPSPLPANGPLLLMAE